MCNALLYVPVDFELSQEQDLFRQTLRAFVADRISPAAHDLEHQGLYPQEIVDGLKQLGLFGISVPENYGGLELDLVSFAIAFEEISRGWMGVAGVLGSHTLACRLLAKYGTEDQRQRFLPELATGIRQSGIALTEPDAGSDLQGIRTTARLEGDRYVVRGTKTWITNARHANPLPVLVKTNPSAVPAHRGMSVLLLEQGMPGFAVSKDLGKLGYKGPETCEVELGDVQVPRENLLGGEEGKGMQQVLSALELGRVNVAARAVGVAQAALDQSLAYAKQRHAFGQPISDFQSIQIKLADMATEVQSARLLTWWAASRLQSGGRADVETGMAKLFASEVALRAATENMRVHGAYGYSTEFEAERLYRDAPLMAIGEGTNELLRTVIARGLLR